MLYSQGPGKKTVKMDRVQIFFGDLPKKTIFYLFSVMSCPEKPRELCIIWNKFRIKSFHTSFERIHLCWIIYTENVSPKNDINSICIK